MLTTTLWTVLLLAPGASPSLRLEGPAELVDLGPTPQPSSEVRIAYSPDGGRMLWGSISRTGGPGGWEIWERRLREGQWGEARPVAFNSPQNDFDPFFAADGKAVYFFSNRPGGQGGDDLYVVAFDPARGTYGEARNLGPGVNTPGDEWAPTVSSDGQELLFASDGHGGLGLHDLFVSPRRGDGWGAPKPLAGLNGPLDDFDAAFLPDVQAIVFARRAKDQDGAELFVSFRRGGQDTPPQRLPAAVNGDGAWTIGPATRSGQPGVLYFSSQRPGVGAGRLQVFRIRYQVVEAPPGP